MDETELPIDASANRHGYDDAQSTSALRIQVRSPIRDQGDLELLIVVRATLAGEVIEVGVQRRLTRSQGRARDARPPEVLALDRRSPT